MGSRLLNYGAVAGQIGHSLSLFQGRIVTMVVRRYHANAHDVAVLSACQQQCDKLREALDVKGERDVTVSSIRDSAGQLVIRTAMLSYMQLSAAANLNVCYSVMYARCVICISLVHAFAVTAQLHNYLSADFMRRLLLSVLADSVTASSAQAACAREARR